MSYTHIFDHVCADEPQRLAALGHTFNGGTFRRLRRLGLPPNARCLDIGTGTGAIARELARLCPEGAVTATDLDVRNVVAHDRVRVMTHDVTVDDFPNASFDVIVARWVFMHLPDPEKMLARVVDWLAPGGCLLLEDGADFAQACSPRPVLAHLTQVILDHLARRAGTDTAWSRGFPRPLGELGLDRLGLDVQVPVLSRDAPMTRFLIDSVKRMADQLVESGSVTAAELRTWNDELTAPDLRDLGLANVAAWGYRPDQPIR